MDNVAQQVNRVEYPPILWWRVIGGRGCACPGIQAVRRVCTWF
jgi:hypothetical protein